MSDYVPLEKDMRQQTWRSPLPISATVFNEELKVEMRQLIDRWHTLKNCSFDKEERDRLGQQMMKLVKRIAAEAPGYDALDLADLICREKGR